MPAAISANDSDRAAKAIVSRPRVLNVNDNPGQRSLITTILSRSGMHVLEATDGGEGIDRISDEIDVVVLDVNLPDIDGFEVCRRIKTRYFEEFLPVLLISAEALASSDRVYGLEGGADGYLTLPVEPRELVATVKTLIRLRDAERTRALQTCRALLTADAVVAMNGPGSLDMLLNQYAQAVHRHFKTDAAAVWCNHNGIMRLTAAAGETSAAHGLIAELPAPALSDTDQSRDFFWAGDDYPGASFAEAEWRERLGLRTWCVIPLLAEKTFYGLVAIGSRSGLPGETCTAIASASSAVGLGIEKKRMEMALRDAEEESERHATRVRQLERELELIERLTDGGTTSVTAQSYGSVLLREANRESFEESTAEFERLLRLALQQRGYKVDHSISDGLRRLSDHLARVRVGPRDVIDIYSTSLKRVTGSATGRQDHVFVEEGRLLVLELMGNLVSIYRASSVITARGPDSRLPSRTTGEVSPS